MGVGRRLGRQKAEAGTASRATAWRRESSRAWSFGGFLKIGHLPGFRGPPKPRTGSSSTWRHRGEGFESKKETPPSDEILYPFRFCPYGRFSVRVRVEDIFGKENPVMV